MATIRLSSNITDQDLIEFDLFTIKDSDMINNKILLKNLEASDDLLNFVIRQKRWRGYSYFSDGIRLIGYGLQNGSDSNGLTETEAYSYFIADFKEKERKFKKIFPLDYVSQASYDALLSLYYHTGSITTTGSPVRQFNIASYINDEKWNYLATALVLSNNERSIRQGEAKIMMLADYGVRKERDVIKQQGIHEIRTLYPTRLDDEISIRQAEYSYYKETNRFLPLMSQSRKRQVVNLSKQ